MRDVGLFDRFHLKVSIVNGCWMWTSIIKRDGYGQIWFDGKPQRAHRVSYLMYKGEVPSGKMVLHSCDNKSCVNPDHLYLGDAKQNTADAFDRKRNPASNGLKQGFVRAKLCPSDVIQIEKMKGCGSTQREIAQLFGVDQTTISRVLLGKLKYPRQGA